MSAGRLSEIQARAEAATEGPWMLGGNVITDKRDVVALTENVLRNKIRYRVARCGEHCLADAEFIAHAREDIPFLLAELARKDRLLQMIVDDNYLLSREDDWERLAVRHIVTARAALALVSSGDTTKETAPAGEPE